jgi:hypothetical protein
MEYWKRIKLSNIDTIISKSLDYVMQNTHHMEKVKFRGPFISISNQEYLKHVPEINEALREHKLFFEDVNIYMMWQNSDIMPHKDYTAAIGRINSPTAIFFFKPPVFPKNNTALGFIAVNKSITVAAIGLPIPKFIMVIPFAVQDCIALSSP